MRRADRLFQIVQLLRVRRLTTAADLARELEISRSFRVDRVGTLRDADPDPARLAAHVPPISLQGYIRAMEERTRCEPATGPTP